MASQSANAHKPPPPTAGPKPKCPECGKAYHHRTSTCSKARKPKMTGKVAGDLAPRRPGPTKGQKLGQKIGVGIVAVQGATFKLRPQWAEDQLTPEEVGELSYALADELLSWPWLIEWIERVAEQGVHIRLGLVVYGIVIPRLARHGMLPAPLSFLGEGPEGLPEMSAEQMAQFLSAMAGANGQDLAAADIQAVLEGTLPVEQLGEVRGGA